jgi:hypothetical protein
MGRGLAIGIGALALAAMAASKGGELPAAALVGDAARVAALLGSGAKPDSKDEQGNPALYLAAAGGHLDAVRALLAARAEVDATARNGATPLVIAATSGHTDVVRALIDGGADPLATGTGVGALEMARRQGHGETARAIEDATVAAWRKKEKEDTFADLSTVTFGPAPAGGPPRRITVGVAADAVWRRLYTSGGATYSVTYWMGDVDRTYAAAVAKALSATVAPGGSATAGAAELRLVAFRHALIAHTPGTLPVVSDEILTKWKAFDASGKEVASLVFIGGKTEDTRGGLTRKQAALARARTQASLEDLYRKTVEGLGASEAVRRLLEAP